MPASGHYKYTENCSVDQRRLSYYLGLIATDGCLVKASPNAVSLALTEDDLSVVCCFASSFVEEDPYIYISRSRNRGRPMASFQASLPYFRRRCEDLGMTPRKSLALSISYEKIPDLNYFLRGVIDGDGTVGVGKKPGESRIVISSGSLLFLEQTQSVFGGRICTVKTVSLLSFSGSHAFKLACSLPLEPEMISRKTIRIREIVDRGPPNMDYSHR